MFGVNILISQETKCLYTFWWTKNFGAEGKATMPSGDEGHCALEKARVSAIPPYLP